MDFWICLFQTFTVFYQLSNWINLPPICIPNDDDVFLDCSCLSEVRFFFFFYSLRKANSG